MTTDAGDRLIVATPAIEASLWQPHRPLLAKLHGCAGKNTVVPPTWAKSMSAAVEADWSAAKRLLETATQVRVIGYSLPVNDSYFKYLLKASAIAFPNLKRFDVLCLDSDGAVEARYGELLSFQGLRFRNASLQTFFRSLVPEHFAYRSEGTRRWFAFNKLEGVHRTFFA